VTARILGEAEGLLFLWKPSGMPVFPMQATGGKGPSLLEVLLDREPEQGRGSWPSGFEGGIAHRLDNGTSGLVVVARDTAVLARFREDLAARRVCKRYRFVTDRVVPWDEHATNVNLGHDPRRVGRMVPRRGARTPHRGRWYEAETHFRRSRAWTWEACIRTGVTHQVRLHAAWVGLALLGDRPYGGHPWPAGVREALGEPLPPFLLHHLGDDGPGWTSPIAPLPPAWDALIDALGAGQA
jgi:23S rRNA pseudouridine1911/1915/1917 synthase